MPPKVNISKLKTARQPVESIPEEETVSSVFSEKPGKNTKGRKTSSPKSNMATIGSESIPDEETVSSVKGKKKSPSSNRAVKGSITSSSSAASDISSDVGSSDVGTPNKANSKTSAISLESHELDLEHWEYLNILTPYNKSQDKFQDMLASLTRSDAHHDLKKVFNETAYKNTGIKRAFDSGIPKQATTSYHEGEAFAAIMLSVSDSQGNTIQINGSEDKMSEALLAVPNCTDGDTGLYSTFEVGVPEMPLFKYKVVKFISECSNNSEFKKDDLVRLSCKSDFGKRFVENTRLGEDSNQAAIVVDFSQHHFMEYLTTGAESQFRIHYLMTPEVVNDPAGKPNVNNKALFGAKSTGVKLMSYVQLTDTSTAYTKFDENDPSTLNNFFSRYDFTLSPIQKILTNQKAEKLITTLNIKYDTNKKDELPLTDTIEDSKDENSIKQVLSYLKNLMEEVKVRFDNSTTFNFNTKIQQKRGGDWFQALCCTDVRNRLVTPVLPIPSEEPIRLDSTCPVYLVTHDQIALTYALFNGVNVIYSDYYGRIFVFKNSSDITLKGSGKSMENILFDGIKETWLSDEQSKNKFLRMIDNAKKYSEDRNEYLSVGRGTQATGGNGKINDFYNKCDDIRTKLESFNFSDKNPIIDFQGLCRTNLQQLFTSAVELTFIKINLVNVDRDISIVESSMEMFEGEYKEDDKVEIAEFSRALNNIKGIQDKFGIIPQKTDFVIAFDNWITGNITKLDVYKCAKKVLGESVAADQSVIFDFNRLISFFTKSHDEERKTDSNIFLPFLQDIEYNDRETNCKDKILSVLSILVPKIEQYIDLVKSSTSSRSSRSTNLHPNELFYNNLSNLIYESFIFIDGIKPSPRAGIQESAVAEIQKVQSLIEYSKSTDNILLKSDKDELDLMNGAGKISNFTGNSEDSVDVQEFEDIVQGNLEIQDDSASKVYNLKCTVKDKSINCTGTAEGSQTAGGYIESYYLPTKIGQPIKTESVICDISLKQINWPLITCNLIQKTDIHSLIRFSQQIKGYITGLDKPENTDLFELIQSKIQQHFDSALSTALESGDVRTTITDLRSLADGLQELILPKGGADEESAEIPTVSKDLMTDFSLGFHPLTPIYAMLTSYYNLIGEKSQSDPFFYTYFTYINILEKMKKVITENYLSNTIYSPKTASSYMIGFGLYFMLFASHTSSLQNDEILSVIQMSQKDYSEFSLKNDGFASMFSGAIHQTPEDQLVGMVLVNNDLFNNFINNEVNIKQILEQGTPVVNLPTYDVLQERIFNLMGEIVVKVNADRGTPITSSPTASGIQGISSEERASRAALGQQRYEENLAKGLIKPDRKTGIVSGTDYFKNDETGDISNSTYKKSRTGGKKKRYTRRPLKTYKNKTIKHPKRFKKTIKHRKN
jgi:hypothetical protein